MILVEWSCLRPTTPLHLPLKAHKSLGTHVQLYNNVVIAQQPFKFPIDSICCHLATGGVVEPLECDACRVIMP